MHTAVAHPEPLLVPLAPALEVAGEVDDQLLFPDVLQLHELVGVQITTAPAEEVSVAFGAEAHNWRLAVLGVATFCI